MTALVEKPKYCTVALGVSGGFGLKMGSLSLLLITLTDLRHFFALLSCGLTVAL
jgi:hypothetical protein